MRELDKLLEVEGARMEYVPTLGEMVVMDFGTHTYHVDYSTMNNEFYIYEDIDPEGAEEDESKWDRIYYRLTLRGIVETLHDCLDMWNKKEGTSLDFTLDLSDFEEDIDELIEDGFEEFEVDEDDDYDEDENWQERHKAYWDHITGKEYGVFDSDFI